MIQTSVTWTLLTQLLPELYSTRSNCYSLLIPSLPLCRYPGGLLFTFVFSKVLIWILYQKLVGLQVLCFHVSVPSLISLRSLSKHVFEVQTATRSELFSVLTCPQTEPHTTTFTLLSILSPLEVSTIKIWETIRSWHVKCFLPIAICISKTNVLKLPFGYIFGKHILCKSAFLNPGTLGHLLFCNV